MRFKIYTDGAVKAPSIKGQEANGPAGWAYLIIAKELEAENWITKILEYGNSKSNKISRMELTALSESLTKVEQYIPALNLPKEYIDISIYIDLEYISPIFNKINGKWMEGEYQNDDLWATIAKNKTKLLNKVNTVHASKVDAHITKEAKDKGIVFNGIVDKMAVHAKKLAENNICLNEIV